MLPRSHIALIHPLTNAEGMYSEDTGNHAKLAWKTAMPFPAHTEAGSISVLVIVVQLRGKLVMENNLALSADIASGSARIDVSWMTVILPRLTALMPPVESLKTVQWMSMLPLLLGQNGILESRLFIHRRTF